MTPGEAIVQSGWGWGNFGTPERLALALGRAGWRVLYCENPASFLRRGKPGRFRVCDRVEGFRPGLLGHRLNALPSGSWWQAKLLVGQVLRQARRLGLRRPIVIYPDGDWLPAVAREWKAQGFFCVYLNLDYLEWVDQQALADLSDVTLAIPRITYDGLRRKFGDKVRLFPQLGPDLTRYDVGGNGSGLPPGLEQIPRPRLGYLGNPIPTVEAGLLSAVLAANPGWHFLACGPLPSVPRANVHDMGWLDSATLPRVLALLDVGFMPYNLRNQQILHGVPLKLFDYFAAGLPVVSTPLVHLREYGDLVYLGETAEELAAGVRRALAEPPNDPRREERRRIAHAHSLDAMSKLLPSILLREATQPLDPPAGAGQQNSQPSFRPSETSSRPETDGEIPFSATGRITEVTTGKTSAARPCRLLVVPHIPAADIRVREIELARRLKNHFESVFCLEWSDALHDFSGGPVRRRWRQATRAIGALTTPVGKPRSRDGIHHVNVPVLQPILLRRLVGDAASIGISRRVNNHWLNRLVEEFGITHVLLATSIFGVPNVPRVETFFDFVDWFPEESASARQMTALRRDLHWIASRVQGLFAVSEPLGGKLRHDYGLDCVPLFNGTDIRNLRAVPQSEIERIRSRWNAGGKFVVGVIGNHGDYVPLDFAVQVFRRLRSQMPDAALWIVGPAEIWRGRLEGEPGVIFTGQVPPEEVAAYFQAIDLGLLVQVRNAGTEYAFQIKVVEYTACRKFVIAPPFETWRRLSWPNVRLLDFDPDAWAAEICSLRKASWDGEWDRIVDPYDWSRLAAEAARIILHRGGA